MIDISDKYKALNKLIEILLFSVEKYKGSKITQPNHYALMIGKKLCDHCISILNLRNIQTYSFSDGTRIEFVDFPSIAVITRSIVESYLAFNHIFINSRSKEEIDLKWSIYDLSGYLERQSFIATTPLNIKTKAEEANQIIELRKAIENLPFFKTFTHKQQAQLLEKENWKLFKSWNDLGKEAGFNPDYFNQTYKYLCSYVHSGRLSILQILDANKEGNEVNLVNANVITCCGVLAKYIFDLGILIPEIKSFYSNLDQGEDTVNLWVKIAENI